MLRLESSPRSGERRFRPVFSYKNRDAVGVSPAAEMAMTRLKMDLRRLENEAVIADAPADYSC